MPFHHEPEHQECRDVRLAKALAHATGESLTAAVTKALRERLARVKRVDDGPGMADRIQAIAVDMRIRLSEDFFDTEHGDLLYGPDGLPR